MKNNKMFINSVSPITFFSFPVYRKFCYQIVACFACFLMFVEGLYRHLFLEDTCSNIMVTQKVHSITGNSSPTLCGVTKGFNLVCGCQL